MEDKLIDAQNVFNVFINSSLILIDSYNFYIKTSLGQPFLDLDFTF